MADIYEQHSAAFANVSAHVILKDGELVARIAFKFPADGAGRLYAYVHWLGVPMVRGYASGCFYDKRTAACSVAAKKSRNTPLDGNCRERDPEAHSQFLAALELDAGPRWDDQLRAAGFTVIEAV